MKKFCKVFFAVVLCVFTMFGLVACNEPELSATTNETTLVESNGGSVVQYNGYLYFINGTKTNDGTGNQTGKVVQSAIYKAKCDEDGNVVLNNDGSIAEISQVVSSLVGFSNGSLHIFGNYLYYTTPNNGKNNKGEVLYYQTCFYRYDLTTGASQRIYTTVQNSTSEEIQFTYYKVGEKLYLLVYEQSQSTITSVEIGNNLNKKVLVDDAQSVVFGENFGEVKNQSNNSVGEKYIYFTRAALETGTVRTGVRVYKILPDGTGEDLLSEGESVSLLAVRSDKLLYSLNTNIYVQSISDGDDTLNFTQNQIISLTSYENVIFVEEDDGGISLVVYETNNIRFVRLDDGKVPNASTENNRIIYTYDSSSEVEVVFVGIEGDYVVYTVSDILYKIKFQNIGQNEINVPEKLSTTSCDEPSGLLAPEIVNGYVYFFNTTDKTTYLYRASMTTPTLDDVDDDGNRIVVGEAILVGVKE